MSTESATPDAQNPGTAVTGSAYPILDLTAGSVAQSPSFPALDEAVLARWDERDTFRESIRHRADAEEYVFYDGPPSANGLPHY